jgi:hypothetical protein
LSNNSFEKFLESIKDMLKKSGKEGNSMNAVVKNEDSFIALQLIEKKNMVPVLSSSLDLFIREISIDDLKHIQGFKFVKSFNIDSEIFANYKFGMFNLRKNIIGSQSIETIDLVLTSKDHRIFRVYNAYYSKFSNEPVWYYLNGISGSVRKIQFNKVFNIAEIEKHVLAIRSHRLQTKSNTEKIFIFENSENIKTVELYCRHGGQNWHFKKNEFGFQIISYESGLIFCYPQNLEEQLDTIVLSKTKRKDLEQFTIIDVDQQYDIHKNVLEGDFFIFFFALSDNKVSKIITKYSERFQRYKVVNEFKNDPTVNILIKVPNDDYLSIFFFFYLKVKKKVNPIEIFNMGIEDVLLGNSSNSKLVQKELCKKYGCKGNELRDIMIEKYGIANVLVNSYLIKPKQLKTEYSYVVNKIFFRFFSNRFNYTNGDDFYLSDVYESFKNDFKKVYADIGSQFKGNMYKSEYLLFKLLSYYFDDTIYQFRSRWLNKMIIDIYVPSLKLAIEFQGQQHYEATEYFNADFQDFSKSIIRDKAKKELCEANGIILVYWPYSRGINTVELNKLLKKLNLKEIKFVPSEVNNSIQLLSFDVNRTFNVQGIDEDFRKSVESDLAKNEI